MTLKRSSIRQVLAICSSIYNHRFIISKETFFNYVRNHRGKITFLYQHTNSLLSCPTSLNSHKLGKFSALRASY